MTFDDLFNIDNSYRVVDQAGNQYEIRMIDLVDPEKPLYVEPLGSSSNYTESGFWITKDELVNYHLVEV